MQRKKFNFTGAIIILSTDVSTGVWDICEVKDEILFAFFWTYTYSPIPIINLDSIRFIFEL